jgi:hypothetical protein
VNAKGAKWHTNRRHYEVIKQADGNACRVSVLAGCEGLVGMVFHVPSATRHAAKVRVQQTLFRARDAANGASADHQE